MINFLMLFFLSFQLVPTQQSNLEWVGGWPFGLSQTSATDSIRELCFLQSGGGVYILDINDPSNPSVISEKIKTEGWIRNISYNYEYQLLFVPIINQISDSAYKIRTEIWNIANPNNPTFIDSFNDGSSIYNFKFKDNLAYIPIYKWETPFVYGYKVFDFSDPYNVQLIYCDTSKEVNCICFKDSLLILSADSIYIKDNSDPINPISITSISENSSWCYVKDQYLFSISNKLKVYNISTPPNPQIIDSVDIIITSFSSNIVCQDKIYLSNIEDLEIVDISNPHNCFKIGYYNLFNYNRIWHQISAYENYIFLPQERNGLFIIDVSNSSNPQIINQFQTNFMNFDFCIQNNFLYLLDLNSVYNYYQLRVIDVYDNSNCYQISSCDLLPYPYSIDISDNYAYIGEIYDSSKSFLEIVDISNPLHPQVIKTCTLLTCYADYLEIYQDILYLSPDHLYDISNPVNPTFISQLPVVGNEFFIKDNFGYLNNGNKINIIDLTNPYYPSVISSIDGYFIGIEVGNNYIYAQEYNDFKVINISDPYNPWLVYSEPLYEIYPSLQDQYNIEVKDNFAVVATTTPQPYTGWGGKMYIIDATDLNNLTVSIDKTLNQEGTHLEIMGEYIFISTFFHGFDIYRYPPLVSVSESPLTSPSLNLNSTMFSSSRPLLYLSGLPVGVEISIYSVDGRKVFSADFTQTEFHLNLNNLNISSGIYFLKVNDQEGSDLLMKKFELLR